VTAGLCRRYNTAMTDCASYAPSPTQYTHTHTQLPHITMLCVHAPVGWVIRPVKTVGRITYIVLVQTLNHAQSINHAPAHLMGVLIEDFKLNIFQGTIWSCGICVISWMPIIMSTIHVVSWQSWLPCPVPWLFSNLVAHLQVFSDSPFLSLYKSVCRLFFFRV